MKLKWEEKNGKLSCLEQAFLIGSDGFCIMDAPFKLVCDPGCLAYSKTGQALFHLGGLSNTGHLDKGTLVGSDLEWLDGVARAFSAHFSFTINTITD